MHGEWMSPDARERREPDKARSVRRALPERLSTAADGGTVTVLVAADSRLNTRNNPKKPIYEYRDMCHTKTPQQE